VRAKVRSVKIRLEIMLAEVLQKRFCLLLLCTLSALCLSQCDSDGFQHATIRGDPQTRVHVLYDSPRIQGIVDQVLQAEQLRGIGNIDERIATAARVARFAQNAADDMGKEPGYNVPGQTTFKILFESGYLFYSKVEFESGPFKGQIGWLSRRSFDDPRTGMP
jgi:hypothetical protein